MMVYNRFQDRLLSSIDGNPAENGLENSMNQEFYNQKDPEAHPSENMPGFGLAAYGCLLILFFIVGIIGMISSTTSMLQATYTRPPFSLSPGNQVEVWRLQPMRDAKLLKLTEVPLWYHDEGSSGTEACALNETALLRVEGGEGWSIPYTAMESVRSFRQDDTMVAVVKTTDGEQLHCLFLPGEGVERFTRRVEEKMAGY